MDTDIRYLRTGDLGQRARGRFLFGSLPWVAGVGAPALAYALFMLVRHRRRAARADVAGMRRRRADRIAAKRLKEADDALRAGDHPRFHTALAKGLTGYFADKLGLGPAETTAATVRQRLDHLPDGPDMAREFAELIGICDMARFAPMGTAPAPELLPRATALIDRTEKALRP
jgi:hypothetical protein